MGASVQILDQLGSDSFPWLPEFSCFLHSSSKEEWWQSFFPFNSSQACWKEPLVYVLFFMPVRSWDEILSINHKAYYYFKYLHLLGEAVHWLPAGEINAVSFPAGTLSLGRDLKRHGSSCSVSAENVSRSSKAKHKFQRSYMFHTSCYTNRSFDFVFLVQKNKLWTQKGEDTGMLIKRIF